MQRHWLSIDVLDGNIWALPQKLNVRNKLGEQAEHLQFQSTVTRQMYGQYDWHLIKNSAADEWAVRPAMPSRRRHRLRHRNRLRNGLAEDMSMYVVANSAEFKLSVMMDPLNALICLANTVKWTVSGQDTV